MWCGGARETHWVTCRNKSTFPIICRYFHFCIVWLLMEMTQLSLNPQNSVPEKNRKSYHLRWTIRGGRIFMRQFHKNGYWVWRPWDIPILFENAELLDIRFLDNWFKSWNFEQNFLMGLSTFLSYFQKYFKRQICQRFSRSSNVSLNYFRFFVRDVGKSMI